MTLYKQLQVKQCAWSNHRGETGNPAQKIAPIEPYEIITNNV